MEFGFKWHRSGGQFSRRLASSLWLSDGRRGIGIALQVALVMVLVMGVVFPDVLLVGMGGPLVFCEQRSGNK